MTANSTAKQSSLFTVFARLKLRLLRNGLKADRRTQFGTVAMFIGSTAAGSVTAFTLVRDAHEGPLSWSRSLIPAFTLMFLAWVFGPLLLGGVDDALDPRRLTLLPLKTSEMIRGVAVGAAISFLPVGTLIALAGTMVGYSHHPLGALVILLTCVTQLLVVFSIGRLLSALLAWTSRTRRGRDIGVVLAAVAAAMLWIAAQGLNALTDNQVDRVNSWLRWTPSGSLAQAIIDARNDKYLIAFARTLIMLFIALAALAAWAYLLERLLTSTTTRRDGSESLKNASKIELVLARLVSRVGGHNAGTIFSKELRYLQRSPGRRAALAISMVMGVPFVILQVLRSGGFADGVVIFAPISLIFGLGAVNNLVGMDGPALWLEVTSGAKLREILVGRGAAAMPFLVIPSTLTALLLIAMSGSWRNAAEVLEFVWFGWGIQVGLGSYLSVVAPFSQADENNPFSNSRASTGSSALVMVVAVGGIFITALLAVPLVIGFEVTASMGFIRHPIMILSCLAYGLFWWNVGVRLALRRIDKRGIDLLGLLTPRSSYQ